MERLNVSEIKTQSNIRNISNTFYVVSIETMNTKGSAWQKVILSDKTGEITGKIWEEYMQEPDEYIGKVVEVLGRVELFNGHYEIVIERLSLPKEKIDMSQFIAAAESDALKNSLEQIHTYLSMVSGPYRKWLDYIFGTKNIAGLCNLPAAKSYYYTKRGEWVTHACEVCRLSLSIVNQLSLGINQDLLIAGALTEAIGVPFVFEDDGVSVRYNRQMRLVGETTYAAMLIGNNASKFGFTNDNACELEHIMLSSKKESTVKPQTLEALIINRANKIITEVSAFQMAVLKAAETDARSIYSAYLETTIDCPKGGQDESDIK